MTPAAPPPPPAAPPPPARVAVPMTPEIRAAIAHEWAGGNFDLSALSIRYGVPLSDVRAACGTVDPINPPEAPEPGGPPEIFTPDPGGSLAEPVTLASLETADRASLKAEALARGLCDSGCRWGEKRLRDELRPHLSTIDHVVTSTVGAVSRETGIPAHVLQGAAPPPPPAAPPPAAPPPAAPAVDASEIGVALTEWHRARARLERAGEALSDVLHRLRLI